MDIDALVNEICKRVQEKISEAETVNPEKNDREKPCLLVLNTVRDSKCRAVVESPPLSECYEIKYALSQDYDCDLSSYEAVIAFDMSNELLGKIAHGIFDSGYTRLFGEALLSGRKVFLPEEEVELYSYRETAPALYYRKLSENLKLLQDSGVEVIPCSRLLPLILTGPSPAFTKDSPEAVPDTASLDRRERVLRKHVITEKDIRSAYEDKAETIVAGTRAILTDLAKEYAEKHRIVVRRRDFSPSERGKSL